MWPVETHKTKAIKNKALKTKALASNDRVPKSRELNHKVQVLAGGLLMVSTAICPRFSS